MQNNKAEVETKKTRIEIKNLPEDMKISNEEMRKIHGGWWLLFSHPSYKRGGW